jgi:hypothetical protein
MMLNSMKRMVLTGAAATVMMSSSAPAMAEGVAQSEDSQFGLSVCDLAPLLCDPPPSSIPGLLSTLLLILLLTLLVRACYQSSR